MSSICKFAITRKNDAFVAKIVNTRLTKGFMAIFAPAESLPSPATLSPSLLTSNWQFLRIKENLEPLGFGALLTQVQKSQKEKLFHNVICMAFCIALEVLDFRYLRIMMVLFQHPLTSSTYLDRYICKKNTSEPPFPASFWFSSNLNDCSETMSSSHQNKFQF